MAKKEGNNQWLSRAPKIPSVKICWKVSCLDFWDQDYLPKSQNNLCGLILVSFGATDGHFEGKTPWEFQEEVWMLHGNAPAHRTLATHKKLAYLGFYCLDHAPYSPDMA
jgi:hypothetical protein